MALASLAQAKAHLRIDTATTSPLSTEDADIQLKLDQAEDMVLRYLKFSDESPAVWDVDSVPLFVHAAVLYQCGELYRYRGDDAPNDGPARNPSRMLSPFAEGLLDSYRDPTLA